MKGFWVVLLLSGSLLSAQDSGQSAKTNGKAEASQGQITVQGCVGRSTGSYILFKQDPGATWVLQGTGKMKLGPYLGQQVEVTGTESPFLNTSSSSLERLGPPSSVTLTITSIRTIAKQCVSEQTSDH